MAVEATYLTSSLLSFGLVAVAEMGDKSQLVCMTLAAKHRARPVLLGAISAFLVLNMLAVGVGSTLTVLIPANVMAYIAAGLFAVFGMQSLLANSEEANEELVAKTSRSVVVSTFVMIFFAEFGDKTQIAVATMSTTEQPVGVWIGASLALMVTTALGVFAGRRWLARINHQRLHQLSGVFFLLLAGGLIWGQL